MVRQEDRAIRRRVTLHHNLARIRFCIDRSKFLQVVSESKKGKKDDMNSAKPKLKNCQPFHAARITQECEPWSCSPMFRVPLLLGGGLRSLLFNPADIIYHPLFTSLN